MKSFKSTTLIDRRHIVPTCRDRELDAVLVTTGHARTRRPSMAVPSRARQFCDSPPLVAASLTFISNRPSRHTAAVGSVFIALLDSV